ACGAANGLMVTGGKLASFVVTLGMMTSARGLALLISSGRPVSNLSDGFTGIGSSSFLSVPVPILIFVVVALVSHVFLKNMWLGRHIYAVGGNENAASASGVNVYGVKIIVYT